jgi:hypothetical protein
MAVVMYVCDIWFLIMGVEHRLRVFENGVLSRILGLGKTRY